MTEHDLTLLHDWLNRDHLARWWGRRRPTMEQVRAHYLPRVLGPQHVTPFIGMLGDTPFAYAQSYVALGAGDGWWTNETDAGVRGIDQSIADTGQTIVETDGLAVYMLRSCSAEAQA